MASISAKKGLNGFLLFVAFALLLAFLTPIALLSPITISFLGVHNNSDDIDKFVSLGNDVYEQTFDVIDKLYDYTDGNGTVEQLAKSIDELLELRGKFDELEKETITDEYDATIADIREEFENKIDGLKETLKDLIPSEAKKVVKAVKPEHRDKAKEMLGIDWMED